MDNESNNENMEDTEDTDAELAIKVQIVELLVASGGLNTVYLSRAEYLLIHPNAIMEMEDDDGEDE